MIDRQQITDIELSWIKYVLENLDSSKTSIIQTDSSNNIAYHCTSGQFTTKYGVDEISSVLLFS